MGGPEMCAVARLLILDKMVPRASAKAEVPPTTWRNFDFAASQAAEKTYDPGF